MKTIVFLAAMAAMTFSVQFLQAQEGNKEEVEELLKQKEQIVTYEKEQLKKEVAAINDKLANNEISIEEAQQQKEEVAKNRALNIENRLAIIDNKIALLQRNGIEYVNENTNGKVEIGLGSKDKNDGDVLFGISINKGDEKKVKYDRRTTDNLILAVGFNNALMDGQSLEDSDYKIAGSRFFELGWVWTTRVFKNSNFLRVNYGISYTSNGLKPTDNRYFVERGNQTELETFRVELNKSKFRMDNLVVPLHLEFGPSRVKQTEDRIRYQTEGKFKIGLGGYIGANISTRQKLKYNENGDEIKDKIKRDYNTSDLIYGLSGYAGFGDTTLYLKYDLSPVFRNALVEQRNISLGVRFDL